VSHGEIAGMAKAQKSTTVNLTIFEILQAVTGELPCYASPNWNVSAKKKDPPRRNASVGLEKAQGREGRNKKALG
jgi:hypothetical protein